MVETDEGRKPSSSGRRKDEDAGSSDTGESNYSSDSSTRGKDRRKESRSRRHSKKKKRKRKHGSSRSSHRHGDGDKKAASSKDRDYDSDDLSSIDSRSDRSREHKKRGDKDRRRSHRKKKKKKSSRRYESDESSSYSSISEDRHKKRKRHKLDDRSSSSYSEDRKKRKKHKRDRKKRKSTSKEDAGDSMPTFGKYGILRASDFHSKQRSFNIWLEEVKGVMSFTGPKWELQNYFKDYMEDYNTATLPHIKYYDYDKWEMEEYQKNKTKTNAKSSVQRDEALHMQSMQEKARAKREEELALVRSMMNKEKVEEMKRKAQLQSEMAHAYKTGDQETYLRLKTRLEPEKY